jgi:hypothetical protein
MRLQSEQSTRAMQKVCWFNRQTDEKSQKTAEKPLENSSETNCESSRQGIIQEL